MKKYVIKIYTIIDFITSYSIQILSKIHNTTVHYSTLHSTTIQYNTFATSGVSKESINAAILSRFSLLLGGMEDCTTAAFLSSSSFSKFSRSTLVRICSRINCMSIGNKLQRIQKHAIIMHHLNKTFNTTQ